MIPEQMVSILTANTGAYYNDEAQRVDALWAA